jgi:hypothetical protein
MLRGSRPGERRGGRKRDTPNRRTVLTDRILSVGSDHPTASRHSLVRKLVKDRKLPADTRMAIAPKCFPAKQTPSGGRRRPRGLAGIQSTIAQGASAKVGSVEGFKGTQTAANQNSNPQVLDALFGIVQDVAADSKARRKAALKIAEFLLPKAGKKAKVLPDDYGFTVNPQLARKYRDIRRELRILERGQRRKIPAVAQKIQKLTAQADAILQRLQVPCPSRYGREQVRQDLSRLIEFIELRANNTALTEAQDDEEAHLRTRSDAFVHGPEQTACLRRQALQDAERQFKKHLFFGDYSYAVPLSWKDERDLELLRWLYPEPSRMSQLELEEFEVLGSHPFQSALPAADGNLYPPDSRLRPASAADDLLVETEDGHAADSSPMQNPVYGGQPWQWPNVTLANGF